MMFYRTLAGPARSQMLNALRRSAFRPMGTVTTIGRLSNILTTASTTATPSSTRSNSSISSDKPTSDNSDGQLRMDKPSYQLTFTCKKCSTRSSHNVSKQAYHSGTVLIQCPGCKNRHLISDHLKVYFSFASGGWLAQTCGSAPRRFKLTFN